MYECGYVPEFAKAVRFLRDYDGDIFMWWKDFRSRPAFMKEGDDVLLITLGVAACFCYRYSQSLAYLAQRSRYPMEAVDLAAVLASG
jgi:hypothetical protein